MKRQMRTVVNAIKRYNSQDEKVSTRYDFELARYDFELARYFGILSDFDSHKSSVLLNMEKKLKQLESEIYTLAVDVPCTEQLWDMDIKCEGLCIDSWNYAIVIELANEKAA